MPGEREKNMTKKEKAREYYLSHQEEIKDRVSNYRRNNLEQIKLCQHKYRQNNQGKILCDRKNHKKRRGQLRQERENDLTFYFRELLDDKCNKCGKDGQDQRMFFHHVDPHTKINNLAQLFREHSMKIIWEEFKKCILLCGSCHVKIHYDMAKTM